MTCNIIAQLTLTNRYKCYDSDTKETNRHDCQARRFFSNLNVTLKAADL